MKFNWTGDVTDEMYTDELSDYITSERVAKDLEIANGEDIIVYLSSPGGMITEGLKIFSDIKSYSGKTTVIAKGFVGSIATVISCAFDEAYILEGSVFITHSPSVFIQDRMKAEELKEQSDMLLSSKRNIANIYSKRTGKTITEDFLDYEKWFSAEDATKEGFFDKVIKKPSDLVSKGDLENAVVFRNIYATIARNNLNKRVKELKEELTEETKEEVQEVETKSKKEVEEIQEKEVQEAEANEEVKAEEATEEVAEDTTEQKEEEKVINIDELVKQVEELKAEHEKEIAELKAKNEELEASNQKLTASIKKSSSAVNRLNTLLNKKENILIVNTEKDQKPKGRFNFGGK